MTKKSMGVGSWVRVTWLAVVFVVGGIGIGCIWWPASQEISQRHTHALDLYDEANTIDAAVRRASQLRSAQSRITSDLAALGGVRSPGAVTAALLQLLHEESKRQEVEIREVAPDAGARATLSHQPPGPPSPKAEVLAPADVSIAVRGPFRNIVSLVAELPRHDVLVDIHDIQLSSTESTNTSPVLDATLHTTVYRLVSLPRVGTSRVRLVR